MVVIRITIEKLCRGEWRVGSSVEERRKQQEIGKRKGNERREKKES